MKTIIKIAKKGKVIGYVLTPIGITCLITRFIYGQNNEIGADGELHLTATGVMLSIGAAVGIPVGVIAWALGNALKKEVRNK